MGERKNLRAWPLGVAMSGGGLGLALAALIGVAFMAAVLALQLMPRGGSPERFDGTVLAVEAHVRKARSGMVAHVRTGEGLAVVELPAGVVCRPGERIALWRRGAAYAVAAEGCGRRAAG